MICRSHKGELKILDLLCLGGGIFTVKMSNFSGKSAEKVMGVNEFDCPAIFLGAGALNFLGVIDDVLEH